MRYNQQDKQRYLWACAMYNMAKEQVEKDPADFVAASIQLHAMKGKVPQKMRRPSFVEAVGV